MATYRFATVPDRTVSGSRTRTESSASRTIRSSRSSRATAPAPTSGAPPSACSTRRSRRRSTARGASRGWKCSPAKRRSPSTAIGCRRRRSTRWQEFRVSIKGPLTTPVGGGIRSLNVTLRQVLDLYACIRPVRYFEGVGSPMKEPEKLNIVVFRENTEDVYAGIEWKAGSPEAEKLRAFIETEFGKDIRAGLGDRHQADVGVRLEASRSRWRFATRSSTACPR